MYATNHARSRAEERYGLTLTQDILDSIEHQIKTGRATDFFPCSETIWVTVQINDRPIRICYRPDSYGLVTVGPMDGRKLTKSALREFRKKKRERKQEWKRAESRVS